MRSKIYNCIHMTNLAIRGLCETVETAAQTDADARSNVRCAQQEQPDRSDILQVVQSVWLGHQGDDQT